MAAIDGQTVTRWLAELAGGRAERAEALFPVVYDELRSLASALLAHERADHTLQPTALVNEAYQRLAGGQGASVDTRTQFFALAARAMRHVLVDHARARGRDKRGGGAARVELSAVEPADTDGDPVDFIALDDALTRLAALDEGKAKLVELRFFAGLGLDEAADALGIARSTAALEWRMARAWLRRAIDGAPVDSDG
jgi:RNA polymerase sigma factor (TIGR02999 family)